MNNSSKKMDSSHNQKAFTLIELMIVVAIIGLLASVAVPSFQKFQRSARNSEGMLILDGIRKGAVSYYNTPHSDSSGVPTKAHFPWFLSPIHPGHASDPYTIQSNRRVHRAPKEHPCGGLGSSGTQYSKGLVPWETTSPWKELNFSLNKASSTYLSYGTRHSGSNAQLTILMRVNHACGDDPDTAKYRLHGTHIRQDINVDGSGELILSEILSSDVYFRCTKSNAFGICTETIDGINLDPTSGSYMFAY